MKKIFIGIAVVVIVTLFATFKFNQSKVVQSAPKTEYKTYRNSRFGYEVQYPKEFKVENISDNNADAIISNKESKIVTYAMFNSDHQNTKELFDLFEKDHLKVKPTYQKITKNFYVISYKEGNNIVYTYFKLGKLSYNGVTVTYPAKKQNKYGPMVEHIYKTFKTPYLDKEYE
ncbi:hypothetical protein [Gottfriedia acidiceleris]|uniref:hypothetical protein n=1 Tax=Gottfriedia acidiceleris TaxID=371036 RepID=UPI003000BE5A